MNDVVLDLINAARTGQEMMEAAEVVRIHLRTQRGPDRNQVLVSALMWRSTYLVATVPGVDAVALSQSVVKTMFTEPSQPGTVSA